MTRVSLLDKVVGFARRGWVEKMGTQPRSSFEENKEPSIFIKLILKEFSGFTRYLVLTKLELYGRSKPKFI